MAPLRFTAPNLRFTAKFILAGDKAQHPMTAAVTVSVKVTKIRSQNERKAKRCAPRMAEL